MGDDQLTMDRYFAAPERFESDDEFNLYGRDLFGEPIRPQGLGPLAERWEWPPFTVFDARSGDWQRRKRAWLSRGIRGEIGRGDNAKAFNLGLGASPDNKWAIADNKGSGTSIFDPVLCELAYRWWCPPGGLVLDPFAGGSVRGIVAGLLGYGYYGIDLSAAQVAANEQQRAEIMPTPSVYPITVSGPMLRQLFHPCDPTFIREVCNGACCEKSSGGILVTVHPSETKRIEYEGVGVENGFIVPTKDGRCPFKSELNLCAIHSGAQPFGCRASPFTLNENDTLVVRNRYRLLRCYRAAGAIPAYVAHRRSLETIFGKTGAEVLVGMVGRGDDKIRVQMPAESYQMLRDNDAAKHGRAQGGQTVSWVVGDATVALPAAPAADFILTCPPYGDLERYSDDPRDLSTMGYDGFMTSFGVILRAAAERLREDRFACIVVGDFRDRRTGNYHGFVADTIDAARMAGLSLYNDAILVTAVGSLPIRVGGQFAASRKLGKSHQNILVFVKGDGKKATRAIATGR